MSNMYGFVNETWNPLAGECSHKCKYCYRKKMIKKYFIINEKYSGNIRIDEKVLNKKPGQDKYIFVCSMTDLFAEDVNLETRNLIISQTRKNNLNRYLFQTKNPKRFQDYIFFDNEILCITLETNRSTTNISNAPVPEKRFIDFMDVKHNKKMITIEPIMDFDLNRFVDMIDAIKPFQVNIGADSGNNNLPEPSKEKINELIFELKNFTKIHKKSNLKRIIK